MMFFTSKLTRYYQDFTTNKFINKIKVVTMYFFIVDGKEDIHPLTPIRITNQKAQDELI